ncbi:hexuronate transporter [bacterium BMS3Bbin06]|nr:hexuronate transporter [bacterium BMS3Abin08]GBE34457.1 hexuronate transporter [bacterium BMS3Bbin06]HDO35354.1 YbfB/YjiJ family MFS transporter [Nitrospirota bacterium]
MNGNPRIHYGWLIVLAGTLCIFASIGIGRFALGMLLPSMSGTLKLTYSEMGFISTANFVGYLVSVLFAGLLVRKVGTRILIFSSLLLVGISMSLIGKAEGFLAVTVLYTLTGIGSGASNVPMMALVSAWFVRHQRGKAAGIIVIGSGFAILLAGKLIPYINRSTGPEGWRVSWLVLGIIVIASAFVCMVILRNSPEDVGLLPAGSTEGIRRDIENGSTAEGSIYRKAIIYHLGAIYFLFGYTYVIYATFIVTTLVNERKFSEAAAGNFWSWVGILSLLSGPVFGTLSDKLGRKSALITVFTIQTLSYLLVATGLPGGFLYLSLVLYGIVAWSIPSIMAALVGDHMGVEKTAEAFGFITFIFGLGQITGPTVAGMIAETTGSFAGSFFMAAAFTATAVLLTAFLRNPGHEH